MNLPQLCGHIAIELFSCELIKFTENYYSKLMVYKCSKVQFNGTLRDKENLPTMDKGLAPNAVEYLGFSGRVLHARECI